MCQDPETDLAGQHSPPVKIRKLTPPRIVEIANPDPEQTIHECNPTSAKKSAANIIAPSCSGLASSSSSDSTANRQSPSQPPSTNQHRRKIFTGKGNATKGKISGIPTTAGK